MKNDLTKFEKDLLKIINLNNCTKYNYKHLMEWNSDKERVKKNLQSGEKIYEALGCYVAIALPCVKDSALCDGCNVREPWEHRCHGKDCSCDNPICMEKQGKITHDELMKIVNKKT